MAKRGIKANKLLFNEVIELINKGYTEKKAMQQMGYKNTMMFYKKLTDVQKIELRIAKVAHRNKNWNNYGELFISFDDEI